MAPGHSLRVKHTARGGGLSTNHQSVEDQCDDCQDTAVAGVLVTKRSAEDIQPSALLTKTFFNYLSFDWVQLDLHNQV